ncbi:helix-turn-helix domain-containing protein [Streptomyces mutabilis]|uniref:helix-turn-helix domain-containing protein n=1 Tax=Streptomyces mutabilis TaxID=67332 RepID=UPI0005BBE939|nr:hypothetical protein [Streptomyces mutabilis]
MRQDRAQGLAWAAEQAVEHRTYAMGAVLTAFAFLEASVNEVLASAAEEQLEMGGGRGGLTAEERAALVGLQEAWPGRGPSLLERVRLVLHLLRKTPFSRGEEPFQSADVLRRLRNALLHYRPEWRAVGAGGGDDKIAKDLAHLSIAPIRSRPPATRSSRIGASATGWPRGRGRRPWPSPTASSPASASSRSTKTCPPADDRPGPGRLTLRAATGATLRRTSLTCADGTPAAPGHAGVATRPGPLRPGCHGAVLQGLVAADPAVWIADVPSVLVTLARLALGAFYFVAMAAARYRGAFSAGPPAPRTGEPTPTARTGAETPLVWWTAALDVGLPPGALADAGSFPDEVWLPLARRSAAHTPASHGFVHRLLTEAGTTLRTRGGPDTGCRAAR